MLAMISSWLTPAFLFLFLNLMIGTIVVASRFGSLNRTHHQDQRLNDERPLARAPSLLDRVKSINFSSAYNYYPAGHEHTYPSTQLERAPSLLERVKSINFSNFYGSEPETKFAPEHDSVPSTVYDSGSEPALRRAPSLLQRVRSIKLSSFYNSQPETELEAEPKFDEGHGSGLDAEHQVRRSKSEHKETPKKRGKMKKSASEKIMDAVQTEEEVEQRRPATTRLDRKVPVGDDGVDAKADDFINRFKQQLKLQRLDSLLRYREMLHGKQKI